MALVNVLFRLKIFTKVVNEYIRNVCMYRNNKSMKSYIADSESTFGVAKFWGVTAGISWKRWNK